MNTSVKISAINVYHPSEVRGNDYFILRHPEIENIAKMLESFGCDKRYIADPASENVLTMSINAAKPIIQDDDIDIILFASTTIEYISPIHAIRLHGKLDIKHSCVCIDMNSNCLGMITIFEQAAMMLKSKASYRKALIVSSDFLSRFTNPNELVPNALMGDAAVAMVLEKTEDNSGAGLIDSMYFTDSQFVDTIVYPRYGVSQSTNMQTEKLYWNNFTGAKSLDFAIEGIKYQLEKHHLQLQDISCFFFSQLSKGGISTIKKGLNISWENIEYIGDEYGYTGVNSPFVAYASRLKKGLLHDGDLIIFWSLGAGYQTGVLLWKV